MVLVLPIAYNLSYIQLASALKLLNLPSCGLSTVIGGFLGLMVPFLVLFFRKELKTPNFALLLWFGLFCLTGATMVLPYLNDAFSVAMFVALITPGLFLSLIPAYKGVVYGKQLNGKRNVSKVTIFSTAIFLYFFVLFGLFPSSLVIVQGNTGSFVNIYAHYFGVFFGITLPSLYLFVKYRNDFSKFSFRKLSIVNFSRKETAPNHSD